MTKEQVNTGIAGPQLFLGTCPKPIQGLHNPTPKTQWRTSSTLGDFPLKKKVP